MDGDLSQQITRKATQLGFCSIGFAKAEELESEGARLREWLRRGFQGTMEWMRKGEAKRRNPELVLEGARSVISVAYNYYVEVQHVERPDTGKISRYAWGEDYHHILEEKLDHLQEFVREISPGARCRRYVDTGPAMDKAWAVRSGIGWLGKHTNVITREYGSWVFLGEIITDLALDASEPIGDFCGTCTACISACPTGAIVEPYVIDSRRCISYLTIEHKGEMSREYLPNLQNWIYGCDVCQDVCPWNSFRKETNEVRFVPATHIRAPLLTDLERMTQEEFSRVYRKTAIKRTKLSGMRRNVRSVIEAQRDESHRVQ